MSDNGPLLQAFIESHDDDGVRLVYADWLEENDQPERAELLRLHCRLVATCCEPDRYSERAGWQSRLVKLLRQGVRPSAPEQTVTAGNNLDMTFAWVPPGTFLMGSPKGEEEKFGREPGGVWENGMQVGPSTHDDEIQHRVILTKGFYLGIHQVTQAQWQAVMGSNPSKFKGEALPVERVSWDDCQEFCERLSRKAGKRFRLPTEAEWEYACRAGTTTPFFFGSTISTDQANLAAGFLGSVRIFTGRTTPVGKFPPNAWGLFDMHGNVEEWCQDWYGSYWCPYESDPKGPDYGSARVQRGGGCKDRPVRCRSANRGKIEPGYRGHLALGGVFFGCRVCLCLE